MINHLKVIFIFFCLFPIWVSAGSDFSSSVPVNDRSQAAFKQGINDALLQVLVKASAEAPESIRQNPKIMAELSTAERFTSQFSYFSKILSLRDGSKKTQMFLKVNFSERIVSELLKKGGVRYWPEPRVSLLMLPVLKTNGVTTLVEMARVPIQPNVIQTVNDVTSVTISDMAEKYGLPIIAANPPTNADKIWLFDLPYIHQITSIANLKIALVAQITITADGHVNGKWLLVEDNQTTTFAVVADSLSVFAEKGLFWAANSLANRYTVSVTGEIIKVTLAVDGVEDFIQYENLFTYLGSLPHINSVMLMEAEGSKLKIAINLKSTMEQFQTTLKMDKKLLPDDVIFSDPSQINLYWNK